MKAIILENDGHPDEIICSFIEEMGGQFEFDILTNLRTVEKDEIIKRVNEADAIVFSSTFSNESQNEFFLKLLDNIPKKELFIHYLSDSLHIILDKFFDGYQPHWDHKIYEIKSESKAKPEGHFFKTITHYLDIIPYYWNEKYGAFFPERPTCIIDNLKDVYLYEPKWIKK